jgi:hypothetical protein
MFDIFSSMTTRGLICKYNIKEQTLAEKRLSVRTFSLSCIGEH